MDPAFIIGLVLAFGALLAMISIEGAHVSALLLPAPMVLVFGATIAVGIASSTLKDAVLALKALPRVIRGKSPSLNATIDDVVGYAERARRDGLLSLENDANEASDPFVKSALQNIADGTDAEDLRIMLEDEIATTASSNRVAARFYSMMGGFAPTIGIIGTVVSLTHVLERLDSPSTLGPMIATAFVATLWGLLSANFIWLPIGMRLARLGELDVERKTLLMEGMLAVQAGSQPRLVDERLRALVAERPSRAARSSADESSREAA
ncbi:motility protein A [Paramicrobacterium agarici]|uniref:Chemotaxis protein MotA n=1 Tax=Paramicrobacterium agarici TaxID=630514 RepID=A0A2A9DXF5_9MICO|nr:MotA/TolQ/ExbB proton channel family protein [Microbacterium agarici]PFG30599.1 chemotaxis protein MotA [Microbacterium agarici]TQO23617.1 chemotaxis protein MotA [Microbacterium agarici]